MRQRPGHRLYQLQYLEWSLTLSWDFLACCFHLAAEPKGAEARLIAGVGFPAPSGRPAASAPSFAQVARKKETQTKPGWTSRKSVGVLSTVRQRSNSPNLAAKRFEYVGTAVPEISRPDNSYAGMRSLFFSMASAAASRLPGSGSVLRPPALSSQSSPTATSQVIQRTEDTCFLVTCLSFIRTQSR